MFVTVQDFVGKYQLSTGMYDVNKLQDYIDKYEKQYLIELLGAEFYDEFISDLDPMNVPQSPNFLTIFNPFHKNIAFGQLIMSDGIIEMLKGFIYFEYSKDLINQMTPYGNVRPLSENSEPVSTLYSMIYTRYNTAIKSYRAIQMYILMNLDQPIGQVLTLEIVANGTNYMTLNNVPTLNVAGFGSGTGLTLNIVDDSGGIVEANIADAGFNYEVNNVEQVAGGDSNGFVNILSVGIGNYRNFKGIQKQTAYWI
jgi:hypothetical protein